MHNNTPTSQTYTLHSDNDLDTIFGVPAIHVIHVRNRTDGGLYFTAQTKEEPSVNCPICGTKARLKDYYYRHISDLPVFSKPTKVRLKQCRYCCQNPLCETKSFVPDNKYADPKVKLSNRAIVWAARQIADNTASVQGLCRQLDISWKTLWKGIGSLTRHHVGEPQRLEGVQILGVDEHVWHHKWHKVKERGPTMFTGMVDLSRNEYGKTTARLLDLVLGRSGRTYGGWLDDQTPEFRDGVEIATLDPFRGYQNAIDEHLEDAVSVIDAFHVVQRGIRALDETRRRVQQETLGHRGRKGDPLYGISRILRAGIEKLTTRQLSRIHTALEKGDPDGQVGTAWRCYQELRQCFAVSDLREGKRLAVQVLQTFHACKVPEIAVVGRTLKRWSGQFLAYFTTDRSTNAGVESINGIIELHRRIARGFRNPDNYRLRMLLACGKLNLPTP